MLGVNAISQLKVFENMMENKLKSLHTAYLAKVISTDGKTAKIQPLGMTKAYGESAQAQSPLSNVPILQSARYKTTEKTLNYVTGINTTKSNGNITDISLVKGSVDVLVPTQIAAGDIVLCVCCERDITDAKRGNNSVPALGRHSMSSSVIVGVL